VEGQIRRAGRESDAPESAGGWEREAEEVAGGGDAPDSFHSLPSSSTAIWKSGTVHARYL